LSLARVESAENYKTLHNVRSDWIYADPECFNPGRKAFTAKSDVYSFGVIMWELVARLFAREYVSPYADLDTKEASFITQVRDNGKRPPVRMNPFFVLDTYLTFRQFSYSSLDSW
jgi:hypothetical protein